MATFREAGESSCAFCETAIRCLGYHSNTKERNVKRFLITKRKDADTNTSELEREIDALALRATVAVGG